MSIPVLTFFNNKGGVGKTTLVYHIAWMLAEMGQKVLTVDLDPQANLTAAFLDEEALADLWNGAPENADTIYKCVQPLLEMGDIRTPVPLEISPHIRLIAGDLALAGFEDELSSQWPASMADSNLRRPFRILTAFWQVAQKAAAQHQADIILVDVGPNLGAINRSAIIGSDAIVIPLAADLFSLQGLRNLGPALRSWRSLWKKRVENWRDPSFELPAGRMEPLGYLAQQAGMRLSRPVHAYTRWINRMPEEYQTSILDTKSKGQISVESDPNCLGVLKHYHSLLPMAQEARKPMFRLKAADGAIGAHASSVQDAYEHFKTLATKIQKRIARMLPSPTAKQ